MEISYKNNQYPIITMRKNNHIIKVYSMVHIAPESFYNDIYSHVSQDINSDFVIHMEGIKESPFKENSLYQDLADEIGFSMQSVLFQKFEFKKLDYTYDQFPLIDKIRINIARRALKKLIEEIKENERIQNSIKNFYYDDHPRKESSILRKIIFGKTITTARSNHAAQQAILDTSNVSLLWGKGHVEEIVTFLINHGYKIEKEEMITIS